MQTINFLGCFFFMPVKTGEGAREVTQQLPVLTALAEDLGLISSIHLWLTTVCNSWSRRSDPSSEFLGHQAQYGVHT